MCRATRDAEQAVSTVAAGPSRPSAKETRPDSTLAALPTLTCPSTPSTLPMSRPA
jgi:hypothetical protein